MSVKKNKNNGFYWLIPAKPKILINNRITEQIRHFKYLACDLTYDNKYAMEQKLNKFCSICEVTNRRK